jgi:hypothetical protein
MTDTPQSLLEPQQAADLATKARELADKLAELCGIRNAKCRGCDDIRIIRRS